MAVAAQRPDLSGPRWSSAVICPRRATYEGLGAEREPVSPQVERWRRRGHAIGDAIRSEIIHELRVQGRRPRDEEEIPWPRKDPIGVGHADLVVPHERHVIEVTSTKDADLEYRKALQAAGYAVNKGWSGATVISVDPQSYTERVYPVDVEALAPQVYEIEQTIVSALRTGELPDRVCATPGDGPAQLCPFASACFAGWERPPLDLLIGFDEQVEELADLEDEVGVARRELRVLEERRDEKRAALRPYVEAGEALLAGAIRVKRSVSVVERFSLAKARAAGHSLPAELEAFVSSSETDRWTVRRIDP